MITKEELDHFGKCAEKMFPVLERIATEINQRERGNVMKKAKEFPFSMQEIHLSNLISGMPIKPAPTSVSRGCDHVSFLIGIGKDDTAEVTMLRESMLKLVERAKEMQGVAPEGGWSAGALPFSVGGTKVESTQTGIAYALCSTLESLPPSEYASALTTSAWNLLHMIGRYEDGFELGEDEGHQP